MPITGLHHVDLAVRDVERSLGFYLGVLGPLGAEVAFRQFPPQEDRDEPGYWALFVFDPDGIRIEVAHWPQEASAARA